MEIDKTKLNSSDNYETAEETIRDKLMVKQAIRVALLLVAILGPIAILFWYGFFK